MRLGMRLVNGMYGNGTHEMPRGHSLQYSDMNEEMRVEAMELCVTACEKHSSSNEVRGGELHEVASFPG